MYFILSIYTILIIIVSAMLLFRNSQESAGKKKSKIDFNTYIMISIYIFLASLLMIMAYISSN